MQTISSKIPKTLPNIHNPNPILEIKERRICPALMLANKRKDKVIDRTNKLINSTTDKKDTKYQGELEGKTEDIVLGFNINNNRLELQKLNAILKLKEKVVVTG